MKRFLAFFGLGVLVLSSLLISAPRTLAADPVVDKEFVSGYNSKTIPDLPTYVAGCTRFVPGQASYASYFDLAVKNDRGADYPIRASIRNAASPENPYPILKYFIQTTFNNYAMGGDKPMSRFTAEDGQGTTLTAGNNYFLCIEQLWNDNATGWFYSSGVTGGYSVFGIGTDINTPMDNTTFGYRTYYIPATTATPGATGTSGTTGTTGGASSATVKTGSGPSSNISSSIVKPANLTAAYSAASKAVVLGWTASTTTTVGGYNVYRSEAAGKDYLKIGDTGKTTITFNDTTAAAGKTYYYMVRAYKDNFESASSNEATAIVPASAAETPTTTSASNVVSRPWYKNPLIWALAAAIILLAGILVFVVLRRRKRAKISKPEAVKIN